MVKPHLSLLVLAHLAAVAAVSAQTSYVFQLPGSLQNGVPPQITGVGDNNFNRAVTSASTATLAGAFKVVATTDGSKFYIFTPNGAFSANSTLSTLGPLTAIAGTLTDAQLSPDGRYLFVVSSQLYIVNTTTDALAVNANTGVPPGATPVAVAFSHDSKTAWIVSSTNTGSTITTVDLGSLQSSATVLNLTASATSMVLSPGDLLYVTSTGSSIYEINPLTLAVTTLGQINVPGTGIPGPLQFTPDGTSAYFINTISCGTCSPYFKLNVQSHAVSSWLPSDGSSPPIVDQVLVAGDNRVFGWSKALTQLWDISPSSLALTPTIIGLLQTSQVLAAAVSNEVPSSRFLYLLFPDLTFDQITLAERSAHSSPTGAAGSRAPMFSTWQPCREGPHRHDPRRTQPGAQAGIRIRHHGIYAMGQHGTPAGLADVAKPLRKPLLERCEFVLAGQVHAAIRGQHSGKDSQMRRHPFGQRRIRPGSQVDLPAVGVLLPQILQQRLVIGQVDHVDRRQRRDLLLE